MRVVSVNFSVSTVLSQRAQVAISYKSPVHCSSPLVHWNINSTPHISFNTFKLSMNNIGRAYVLYRLLGLFL